MSFNGGVASSYLASFRPAQAVPGFENVLSNQATNLLGAIPGENAALQAQLAASALQEVGATERLQRNLDAIALENELRRKDGKKLGALRMAGSLLGSALPGSGDAGVAVGDPLALLDKLGAFSQNERQRRANNSIRSNTLAAELLKSLS